MDWNSTSESYDLTPLGASEGDWRWLFQGAQVSTSGFSNWIGGVTVHQTPHIPGRIMPYSIGVQMMGIGLM